MKYQIVYGNNPEELSQRVNIAMDEGWNIYMGPYAVVIVQPSGMPIIGHHQAMVIQLANEGKE